MLNDALILTFEYLSSVIPATIIGIFLMELLIEVGWIQKLGFVTAPFMHFGHLREEVGVSFLASFGSPTAGNSMIADLNKKGLIERKETLIASLVTSFPATFIFVRDLTPILIILLVHGFDLSGYRCSCRSFSHRDHTCYWAYFTTSKEIPCNSSGNQKGEIQSCLTKSSFFLVASP